MKDIGHFIAGKHVAGSSGRAAPVYDPARGTQTAEVALASAAVTCARGSCRLLQEVS